MRHGLVVVVIVAMLVGCSGSGRPPALESPSDREARLAAAHRAYRDGVTADKAGRLDRAREHYEAALRNDPEFGPAWNNLGRIHLEQGDYVSAQQALLRAADLSLSDPRPYENLGLVYWRTQWTPEALKYYGMALERDPNSINALRGAIAASMHLNQVNEESLERVRRALLIETNPQWRREFEFFKIRVENELKQSAQGAKSY